MYQAELHRNESVLTAAQSDTLRGMGILSANSDGTPNLDLSPLDTAPQPLASTVSVNAPESIGLKVPSIHADVPQSIGVDAPSNIQLDNAATPKVEALQPPVSNTSQNIQVSMPVEIIIQGNADNSAVNEIKAALNQLEATFGTKVRQIIEEIFAKELAGLEG